MSDTKIIKYKSGLTLIYKKRTIREAVYIEFRFRGGLFNDPKGKEGLSHFAEHAVAFANNTFTKAEKTNYTKGLYSYNFGTGADFVEFHAYIADEEVEECIKNYVNYLTDFKVDECEFENERKVIIQEITQKRVDINSQIYADVNKFLRGEKYPFKDKPFITAAGTVETVNNITRDDVQNYLTNNLTQDNCIITVVGNISLNKIKKLISKYVIKQLPIGDGKHYNHRDELKDYGAKPLMNISPSPEQDRSRIVIAAHCLFDDVQRIRARAGAILQENFYASAKEYFRDKFGLSYAQNITLGNATFSYINKQYGYYEIVVSCDKNNIAKVLEVLPEYYSFLQNYKIDEAKLEELQTKMRRFAKCASVRTYSRVGDDLVSQYFDRGSIYTKKENKQYKKQCDKISLDFVNNYMRKVLTTKPFILIVSNTTDKLPEYSKICRDIKKHLSWVKDIETNTCTTKSKEKNAK